MIVQNNTAPWVFLALVVLAGAIGLGFLLNDSELVNPTRARQEAFAIGTYSAIKAQATQANLSATQTLHVAIAQAAQTQTALPVQATQTSQAFIARATEHALQQTSSVESAQALAVQEGLRATQQAISAQQRLENIKQMATVTALAVALEHDSKTNHTEEVVAGVDVAVKGLLALLLILAIILLAVNLLKSLHNEDQQPVGQSLSNRTLGPRK